MAAKAAVGCGHASCAPGKGCSMGKGQGKGNWIKGAIGKPGALHKEMKIPPNQKIPAGRLAAAAKKGGKLGKRARLAETLKGLGKGQDVTRDDYENDPTSADSLTMSNKVRSRSPGQLPHQAPYSPPSDDSGSKDYTSPVGGGQARKAKKIGKGQSTPSAAPKGMRGAMPLPGAKMRPKAHHPHRPAVRGSIAPPRPFMAGAGVNGTPGLLPPPPGGGGPPLGGPGGPPPGGPMAAMGGGPPMGGPPAGPPAGGPGGPLMPGMGQARRSAPKKSAVKKKR